MSLKLWDRASFVMACVLMAEAVLGSSGRWLVFGPVSIRQVLSFVFFVVSAPLVVARWRSLRRNLSVWLLVLAIVAVLLGAGVGLLHHNRHGFVAADISTLLYLALIPGILATLRTSRRVRAVLITMAVSAVVLAVVHLVIFTAAYYPSLARSMNAMLNRGQLGGLSQVGPHVHRVYIRSGIFMPVALGFWLSWFKPRGLRLLAAPACGLLVLATLVTATRGFLLTAAIMVLGVIVLKSWTKATFTSLLAAAVCSAVFMGIAWAVAGEPTMVEALMGRGAPSATSTTHGSSDLDVSDSDSGSPGPDATKQPAGRRAEARAAVVRSKSVALEKQAFLHNPVIGKGLGYNLDSIRHDGRTEYMYLDYLAKLGAIGTLGLLAVFFVQPVRGLWWALRRRGGFSGDRREMVLTALGLLAIAAVSVVNPFLNNPLGISMLLVTLAAVERVRPRAGDAIQPAQARGEFPVAGATAVAREARRRALPAGPATEQRAVAPTS